MCRAGRILYRGFSLLDPEAIPADRVPRHHTHEFVSFRGVGQMTTELIPWLATGEGMVKEAPIPVGDTLR